MKLSYFALLFITLYVHQSNSMMPWNSLNLLQNLQNVCNQIKQALHSKSNLDSSLNTPSSMPTLHKALNTPQLRDFVEPLLKAGADPNHKEELDQWAPLHYTATVKNKLPYLRLLLKYKADVNSTNKNHETPLMFTAKFGNYEGAKLLLKYGANPNMQDKWGDTALYKIVGYYPNYDNNYTLRENMIKLLLYHGTNPHINNSWSKTAIDLARENGFNYLAQLMASKKVRFARQLLIILKKAGVAADMNIAQHIADFVYNSHA